jgi:hypothetical protein
MKLNSLLFLLIFAPGSGYGLESGAAFLKINTDARAVSMGSAYTALAEGAGAIAYNPAGLASLKSVEAGFSHTEWLMDSRHDFVGIAVPVNRKGLRGKGFEGLVLGVGLVRLSNAAIEVRNADRSLGGSFTSYDQSVSVGMAKMMGRFRAGLGVKYIESVIAGDKARAAAVDFGLTRSLGGLFSAGLSVQNLGTPMRYISQKDPLPLTIAAGLAVGIAPGFNVALDLKRLVYDQQGSISIGSEYTVLSTLALRTGYMMNDAAKSGSENGKSGFAAGAGINFWKVQLDYSVLPYGDLGNTQKITIKKQF